MIKIASNVSLNEDEVKYSFIRSSGPGGQNVNKVATAVQLRFNVVHSLSLPEDVRLRLLSLLRNRVTGQGDIIIKADRYRTQERNKKDAFDRLIELIKRAANPPKKRKKTQPTFGSIQKRLTQKKLQSKKKSSRSTKGGLTVE